MGKEVRKVPPNWEHPKKDNGNYQPMYENYDYVEDMAEWMDNHNKWINNCHPDQLDKDYDLSEYKYYAQYEGNPPDVKYYNTYYTEDEATWYQLYETVSEGCPISPPFETKEELAEYLAENGDFWYQDQQKNPSPFGGYQTKPSIEQARRLIDIGGACSAILTGGKVLNPWEQQDYVK